MTKILIMTGDLEINGKDAYTTWGVSMGDDFISNILSPAGLKDFIQNESRLENGKRVIHNDPKLSDRDVTLTFFLEGDTSDTYLERYKAFVSELQKGGIIVFIPSISKDIYKFTVLKFQSYALNRSRTFSKISVKLNEYNPSNRS